jgi:hypothetical protein
MKRFHILGTLVLGSALMIPAVAQQTEEKSTTTTTTTTESHRYYDSSTKAYHDWNANEDRAYRMYLQERHKDYVEFPKTTTSEQTEYWRWRHDHPDKVIIKSESTTEQR